jgi:hypothetical protein
MGNPADANAIVSYLNAGGQVQKGAETIPATAQEIVSYLATRGVAARYSPGDAKLYLCNRRRMSASALVALANRFRREDNAPLFALRLEPSDSKPGAPDL